MATADEIAISLYIIKWYEQGMEEEKIKKKIEFYKKYLRGIQ